VTLDAVNAVLAGERPWGVAVGDVLAVLRQWPEQSVHCIVTSPPYLWLRAYQDGDEVIAPSVWPPVPAGHWADGWGEADWAAVDGCEHEWVIESQPMTGGMITHWMRLPDPPCVGHDEIGGET